MNKVINEVMNECAYLSVLIFLARRLYNIGIRPGVPMRQRDVAPSQADYVAAHFVKELVSVALGVCALNVTIITLPENIRGSVTHVQELVGELL